MNQSLTTTPNSIDFPDWYVSLSFGKSNSPNYPQAVELAKMAPIYLEQDNDGQILHQAVYSDKANEYLQFIQLYELVRNWKGHYVVINGELVDRKIISGLNYCYGDRCRSANPDFCFGASPMTGNPFGCHRMQISNCNHPWWSFHLPQESGLLKIDKEAILRRMVEYSEPYRHCPAFNWERAVAALKKLPDYLTREQYLTHAKSNSLVGEIRINIEPPKTEAASGCSGCGCASTLVCTILGILLLLSFLPKLIYVLGC